MESEQVQINQKQQNYTVNDFLELYRDNKIRFFNIDDYFNNENLENTKLSYKEFVEDLKSKNVEFNQTFAYIQMKSKIKNKESFENFINFIALNKFTDIYVYYNSIKDVFNVLYDSQLQKITIHLYINDNCELNYAKLPNNLYINNLEKKDITISFKEEVEENKPIPSLNLLLYDNENIFYNIELHDDGNNVKIAYYTNYKLKNYRFKRSTLLQLCTFTFKDYKSVNEFIEALEQIESSEMKDKKFYKKKGFIVIFVISCVLIIVFLLYKFVLFIKKNIKTTYFN